MDNANLVRKVIPAGEKADGTPTEERVEFLPKKFHAPEYADRQNWWQQSNKMPKPNSKKQVKLRNKTFTPK